MPKTAAFSTITLSLSNLLWDLLVLGYDLLVESYPHLRIGPPPPLLPPRSGGGDGDSPGSGSGGKGGKGKGGKGTRRLFWGGSDEGGSSSPYEGVSDEEEGEGMEEDEHGFVTPAAAARLTGGAIAVGGGKGEGEEEAEGEEDDEEARAARRRAEVRGRVRSILLVNGTAYAASIVFMSLGTMVYPGLGTTIGAILADCTPLLLGL